MVVACGHSCGGGERLEMALRDYCAWWQRHEAGEEDQPLYLKDWHFVNEFPDYHVRSREGCLDHRAFHAVFLWGCTRTPDCAQENLV